MVKSLTWSKPKLAKWQAKNHSLPERRPPSTRHFHNKRNEIAPKHAGIYAKSSLSKAEEKGRFLGKHASLIFMLAFRNYKGIKMCKLVD